MRIGTATTKSIVSAGTSLGSGHIRTAAAITAGLVAITTTLNVAAAKYAPNAGYTGKFALVLTRILGPQVTNTIFFTPQGANTFLPPGFQLGVNLQQIPQGIVPLGPLNQTTFAGAVIILINGALHMLNIPYYNKYASPFLAALGIGNLAGGVIGGLLDPAAPSNRPVTTTLPLAGAGPYGGTGRSLLSGFTSGGLSP